MGKIHPPKSFFPGEAVLYPGLALSSRTADMCAKGTKSPLAHREPCWGTAGMTRQLTSPLVVLPAGAGLPNTLHECIGPKKEHGAANLFRSQLPPQRNG